MNRLGFLCVVLLLSTSVQGQTLQEQLTTESAASLAKAARSLGDSQRGAILFHQPLLACTKCHSVDSGSSAPMPGPDLTRPEKTMTAESIVESILEPSKVIRRGYESVVVQLMDGKTITGLFVEETADTLVLRDVARPAELIKLPIQQIDERSVLKTSIMPAGQVNVLANRQQFLDLVRYLIDIAEGGPQRARQLQPAASLFALVIPEYEQQIDHAGMLRDLDEKSFRRGEAIYLRLCANCHGTREQPGSLPTSLKFAEGKFKNGHEPYRMYQTLTRGFGLMAPQTWMVPQQKYDVIHYVREAYLKPHNASQYATVDATYLASLPSGNSRGPAPSTFEPWSAMNYGPFLTATYEVGADGSNFAHKGIAVRLDPGPGGVARGKYWQVFDHDTLRMAAGWSSTPEEPNFIDWHGINFDGRHQIHPRVSGQVYVSNPTGPGWADPETGLFDDPRILGRDKKHYGPLPRSWGRYRGTYQNQDQVILSYTIGSTDVLEMPGLVRIDDRSAKAATESSLLTRTFQIGSRSRPMLLKVATHSDGESALTLIPADAGSKTGGIALVSPKERSRTENLHGASSFGGKTFIVVDKARDFDLTNRDFTIRARIRTKTGGTIFCQGPAEGLWAPDGKTLFVRGGRLTFDIGWVGVVGGKSNIADDRWHEVGMSWQHEAGTVRLFVDGKLDGQGTLKPKANAERQTIRIGFTTPNFPDPTFFSGQMSDLRFYQQRASDEEFRNPPPDKDHALVAHWKLDAASDDVVRDQSGFEHHGKVAGGFGKAVGHGPAYIVAGLSPMPRDAAWLQKDGSLELSLPAGEEPLKFVLSTTSIQQSGITPELAAALTTQPPLDLVALTKGGPARWVQELKTDVVNGADTGPFAVDQFTLPANNPWFAQLRLTGFDFDAAGDRMAVCTWDGDVWLVSGLLSHSSKSAPPQSSVTEQPAKAPLQLTWKRIANGLFQPLGLKIVDGSIYVSCRDQIAILHDLNNDGETDFIECFNSDHQVTEHFHEFAMGLQTDANGDFYYAKSARHALPAVVPHHGTLLKVSKDGSQTEILANGFRAANGVCLNPDGTFVVTDQEGHWNPKNRINWVKPAKPGERPRFYGNLFGYHDVTDPSNDAMQPPLCWITNAFDRSPAELLWVTSDKWGPLKGSLLNLSYGYGKVFVVPHETVSGRTADSETIVQGGMCELPLPTFPTGIMRGRFHPVDGQLYTCGMFAWAGNATQPGGFYRIRATGRPVHVPIGLNATTKGMRIKFSGDLSTSQKLDESSFKVRTWSLKRSADYGSKHYDEKTLEIGSVRLSDDRRTVFIEIPKIEPTWCMSIEYTLIGSNSEPVSGLIHNTIHLLGK